MTDEQLAVLLRFYSERLEAILCNIETALPAEVTRTYEWWDGEEKLNVSTHLGLEFRGFELRPTGHVLALSELREFISDLLRDTSLLRNASHVETTTTLPPPTATCTVRG